MEKVTKLIKMTTQEQRQCLLDMAKYIDQLCLENNIRYSMMFGTLLGAVRHQGFIPWDDDIDLAFPRSEYDKLKNIFKNNKNDRYIFIDNLNDPKYISPWAKIIDTKTYIVENKKRQSDNYGIFIDIFPYDRLPSRFIKVDYYKKKIFNQLFNGLRQPHQSGINVKNLLKNIRGKIALFLGKKWISEKYDRLCRKNNIGNNDKIVSANIADYNGAIDLRDFNKISRMKFENITLNSFKGYDRILKKKYGNYMQLPPIKQRATHEIDAYWK